MYTVFSRLLLLNLLELASLGLSEAFLKNYTGVEWHTVSADRSKHGPGYIKICRDIYESKMRIPSINADEGLYVS